MLFVQTGHMFPLSSVKPLEEVSRYRSFCLDRSREVWAAGARRRECSPVDGARLESVGSVNGFEYGRCVASRSLFLAELPAPGPWSSLLADVSRYRQSPQAFPLDLTKARAESVYLPKLEWIQDTLRLQGVTRPRLIEVTTPPSGFTEVLRASCSFAEVATCSESEFACHDGDARPPRAGGPADQAAEVAVLLESLDRAWDPVALLRAVVDRLAPGGLIFVTAQVASGFDIETLGLRDLYLYPPDRANCFSLSGLERTLVRAGFTLLEVSTPGVLDVEIVRAHVQQDPSTPVSAFERRLLTASAETRDAFQTFLQQHRMSSFARVVGKK